MRAVVIATMVGLGVAVGWLSASVLRNAPVPPARLVPSGRRVHVVAINGGGAPAVNFQSHLGHLRALVALLGDTPAELTVFSGDGSDPAPDLAARDEPDPDFWLVEGTPAEGALRKPLRLVDSQIPGVRLYPATRAALAIWFLTARSQMAPGDTLFFYVTDHGSRDPDDPAGSRISLWGPGEALTTADLGQMLDGLDPGVRVVALMSQCFSGGFASLWDGARNGCGFFSTTRERRAYGCYPENRGRDGVGHSFLFLRALAGGGTLDESHRETLLSDATPDVPLRTSDLFLARLLAAHAEAEGRDRALFVDQYLAEAWREPEPWSQETTLLDRVSDRFGMPGPSSLATLELAVRGLEEVVEGVHGEAERAHQRQVALASQNALAVLERGAIADASLLPLLREHGGEPLQRAHQDATRVAALAYRTEVRLAAAVRLRLLLTRLAGRVYLARAGTAAERQRYRALEACESWKLPGVRGGGASRPEESFPSWDEDAALARALLPQALEARLLAARPAPRMAPAPGLLAFRGQLPAALAGQRMLLAFWATWCQPCQRELPALAALARERSVPLVAVTDEPRDKLVEFFQGKPGLPLDNVAMDVERGLFNRFAVTNLPTVLLLAADGTVQQRTVGYSPLNDFGLGGPQDPAP